jgi:restriction system protein
MLRREAMASMSGRDFERLIAAVFRRLGFTVTGFGGNGTDGRIDLGLAKDGRRFLVQCKHWRKEQVGITGVADLCAVMAAHAVHGAFLVTSGHFTSEARQLAAAGGIQLIDGALLASMIDAARPAARAPATSPPPLKRRRLAKVSRGAKPCAIAKPRLKAAAVVQSSRPPA